MRFDRADASEIWPDAGGLYVASVYASFLIYFATLLKIAIAWGWQLGSFGTVLSILFLGGVIGLFVMIFIAVAITGPIGTGIGWLIFRVVPSGRWRGGATGALTAILLLVMATGTSPENYAGLDAEVALWATVFIAEGALAGWFVQRRILD